MYFQPIEFISQQYFFPWHYEFAEAGNEVELICEMDYPLPIFESETIQHDITKISHYNLIAECWAIGDLVKDVADWLGIPIEQIGAIYKHLDDGLSEYFKTLEK